MRRFPVSIEPSLVSPILSPGSASWGDAVELGPLGVVRADDARHVGAMSAGIA